MRDLSQLCGPKHRVTQTREKNRDEKSRLNIHSDKLVHCDMYGSLLCILKMK